MLHLQPRTKATILVGCCLLANLSLPAFSQPSQAGSSTGDGRLIIENWPVEKITQIKTAENILRDARSDSAARMVLDQLASDGFTIDESSFETYEMTSNLPKEIVFKQGNEEYSVALKKEGEQISGLPTEPSPVFQLSFASVKKGTDQLVLVIATSNHVRRLIVLSTAAGEQFNAWMTSLKELAQRVVRKATPCGSPCVQAAVICTNCIGTESNPKAAIVKYVNCLVQGPCGGCLAKAFWEAVVPARK